MASRLIESDKAIAYQADAAVWHWHNYRCFDQLHRNFDLAVSQGEDAGYFSEGSDIRAGEDAPAVPELAGHELLLGLMDTADKLYDNYAALIELARRQLRCCEQ